MRGFDMLGRVRAGRRLSPVLALSAVVAAGVAGYALLAGENVSAKPLPRGSLVTVAAPDKPASLDRPAVMEAVNGVRADVKAPALAPSTCLDGLAATLAGSFATGRTPTAAPGTCGRVDWGWVAGLDPTGGRQAQAAYGRTSTGPSPLVGKTAKHLGLAVGRRRESGAVTGYVLVWAVSA